MTEHESEALVSVLQVGVEGGDEKLNQQTKRLLIEGGGGTKGGLD